LGDDGSFAFSEEIDHVFDGLGVEHAEETFQILPLCIGQVVPCATEWLNSCELFLYVVNHGAVFCLRAETYEFSIVLDSNRMAGGPVE
jgi:hypothetical protein